MLKIIRFFRSLDRGILFSVFALFLASALLINVSSKAVALRIGVSQNYFIDKQIVFLILGIITMFVFSKFDDIQMRRVCVLGFLSSIALLIITKFFGYETKGAKRWISVAGVSIQASEFLKPFFWVVIGFVVSKKDKNPNFPSAAICMVLYSIAAFLLISQPDFGMLILVSLIFFIQIFVSGIPIILTFGCVTLVMIIVLMSYIFIPHVNHRISTFLDFGGNQSYQIKKSLQAFYNGGFFGMGLGEGVIKQSLPDSHTDFVFAVIAEEFGAVACVFICFIFVVIVVRGYFLLIEEENKFRIISMAGILGQLGLQSIINMGVSMRIFPTKGMTLPIISYGGSSTLSICISFGILLAFTKSVSSNYKVNQFIKH